MPETPTKSQWIESHPDFVEAARELRTADLALTRAIQRMEAVRQRLLDEYEVTHPLHVDTGVRTPPNKPPASPTDSSIDNSAG